MIRRIQIGRALEALAETFVLYAAGMLLSELLLGSPLPLILYTVSAAFMLTIVFPLKYWSTK